MTPARGFRRLATLACISLAVSTTAASGASAGPQAFDIVIAGGRVIDGTGNPWFIADVGIRGDQIAAIGDLDAAGAALVIDATGRLVTPGFIDLHSHADEGNESLANPAAAAAPNLVSQGITTVVVGQDGRCRCPIGERAELYRRQGIGLNVVQLLGHGSVRQQVMGRAQRQATPEEIEAMVAVVRQGMREGAGGLSSGLEYNPGRYGTTEEVIALAAAAGELGGFYISHERSEGRTPMWWLPSMGGQPPDLVDAVLETIRIGEATGMTVVASHIKVKGADYWGTAPTITRLIAEARERGVQVYADQYPYTTTGSDGNTVVIPSWALDVEVEETAGPGGRGGGDRGPNFAARRAAFQRRLEDPEAEIRIRDDIAHEIRRRGGAERLLILESHNPEFVGLNLSDVAASQGAAAVDVAIMLQLEGLDRPGGARIRGFSLDELDVEHYMAQDFTATSTDAGITLPGSGFPHPRFYGSYPRKLRHYVLDNGVMSMGQAVRSSTSLPAQIAGLARRGILRAGYAADVVVIDTAEIADHATAMDPHRYSTGVDVVVINGELAVRDGARTGSLSGRVLDGDELARRPLAPAATGTPRLLPRPALPNR